MLNSRDLLITFVLVSTSQMINCDELAKGVLQVVYPEDINTEIQDAIERVAVVVARQAGNARAQSPAEYLVYPRCLGKFRVYFPVCLIKRLGPHLDGRTY